MTTERILGVTAHRSITVRDAQVILQTMIDIVRSGEVDVILFGGAIGGDTIALRGALHFRRGTIPRLGVVVPDTVKHQPISTQEFTYKADFVVELKNPITSDNRFLAYTLRDQYIVDQATSFLAFYSGNPITGTGKTVRMAQRKGIPVQVVTIRCMTDG